jgi:hypothetical protein
VRGFITLVGAIFVCGGALYTRFQASGGSKLLKSKIMQNVSGPPSTAPIRETNGLAEVPVLDSALNRFV